MTSNGTQQPDTLDQVVEQAMEKTKAPGVAVGIMRDGELLEAKGYGVISLATNYPTHPDTLFQIGSNTKVFTATAMLRLVEEGKVKLDTPIKEYIPDLRLADEGAQERVTVRHLLTHTSGIEGDRFEDTGVGDDALAIFVSQAHTWGQDTDPGELWSYCNAGWDLAGRIIECVTGTTYEAAMRQYVFAPLGLERSFFFAHECIMYSVAAGHTQNPGQDAPQVAHPWPIPRASHAAGAIISNVQDLLTFCNFHMGDGKVGDTQVLTRATMDQMQTPQAKITDDAEWGLGWALDTYSGTRVIRHGGGTNGHITMMSAIPSQRFAISVLTNCSTGGGVIKAVEEWAFEKYCDLKPSKPAPVTLPAEQLARLAGTYRRPMVTTVITADGDVLKGKARMKNPFSGEEMELPEMTLTPIGDWEAMTDDGGKVQFIPTDAGQVRFVRLGGRIAPRQG